MSISARDALQVLYDILTEREIDPVWDEWVPGPFPDNFADNVEIIAPEGGWGFIKVRLQDGSDVCFSVMSVGGGEH